MSWAHEASDWMGQRRLVAPVMTSNARWLEMDFRYEATRWGKTIRRMAILLADQRRLTMKKPYIFPWTPRPNDLNSLRHLSMPNLARGCKGTYTQIWVLAVLRQLIDHQMRIICRTQRFRRRGPNKPALSAIALTPCDPFPKRRRS